MKSLLIVNGPPGVGKTAACERLYRQIENSVWLDGDWCWMMNPFTANEENKRMVEDNITHLLRNFLTNSKLEMVIFSWVIPRAEVFDIVLGPLADLSFNLQRITLVCSPEELRRRMIAGGREEHKVQKSTSTLPGYLDMDTFQLDTTVLSPDEAATAILKLLTAQ
ncbi:MAG: nucleotide kinase [Firmicutes bacterium]|nr:nucleotide kinase [Bacillota bacterium]